MIEMPDISEPLKKLQEIKDKKDRRHKYFNIYFYVQLTLNVLIDVALVITVLKILTLPYYKSEEL
jgi:predicted nucleic acid-binding Zn ribbon protein